MDLANSPKLDWKHFLKFGPELAHSSLTMQRPEAGAVLSDEAENHSLVVPVKCGCGCALHKTRAPKFQLQS